MLVTGRRVLMLHGDGSGGTTNSAAPRRHTYGVVEWEVDFGLVVWLEIDEDGEESSPPSGQRRARGGGRRGASLSLFHFPDLSAERSGDSGSAGENGQMSGVFAQKMMCSRGPYYGFTWEVCRQPVLVRRFSRSLR